MTGMQFEQQLVISTIQQAFAGFIHQHQLDDKVVKIFEERQQEILDAIAAAYRRPADFGPCDDNNSWHWQELSQQADHNVGLLHVYANQHIPIHDHPGSSGLLIVLKGQLSVTEYIRLSKGSSHITELMIDRQSLVECLSSCSFDSKQGNIHSIKALAEDSIILDVLLSPYEPHERSWYLPVGGQQEEPGKLLTLSMRKQQTIN